MSDKRAARRVRVGDLGRSPIMWLAFGLGTGLSPRAPGTVGTVPGLLLGWLLVMLTAPLGSAVGIAVLLGVTLVLFAVGIYLCDQASRRLGVHDHGGIVFDEIVGVLPVFVVMPQSWWELALIFVCFRVFDVIKPWPIGWLDRRVAGGFGIMVDDLLAGGYALIATWASVWLLAGA